MLFTGDLSGADDGVIVELVEFFGGGLGGSTRVCFPLVSGHLVSEGGNILVDLSGHGVFAGSLCERDSCAVLSEMCRLAGRALQATAGDHDRDRALLDEIVGGGTEEDALELANTPRADDDHCRLHKVDDVKQHVSCILGVPGLAGDGYIELGPLQKADRLPDEDVSQALALLLVPDLGRAICWVGLRRIDFALVLDDGDKD